MNRTDRIAIVSEGLPFGGTTTMAMYLARGLRDLGAEAMVFNTAQEHPLRAEFEAANVPFHCAPDSALIYEDRLAATIGALAEFNPTAVLPFLSASSFEILRYAPEGVLRVGTIHDHAEPVYQLIGRYLPWQDLTVGGVAIELEEVARRFPDLPRQKYTYGIPAPPDRPRRVSNPDETLRILFFGRFQQSQKRVRIFPEIRRELKKRNVRYQWTIHGAGPEEAWLREALSEGVSEGDIRFSSPVPDGALRDLISRHDVFLLTSAHEGGPLTLLEAMSQGLAPVCGEIPCLVTETVSPENGVRVPFDAPAAYAEALAELANDRPRLDRLSSAAIKTIEQKHSESVMALRFLDIIKEYQPETPEVQWPAKVRPLPLLSANPMRFHPLVRPLRRLVKRLSAKHS